MRVLLWRMHQLPEISKVKVGMANLFIKHTSASLSINENCDEDVRYAVAYHNEVIACRLLRRQLT